MKMLVRVQPFGKPSIQIHHYHSSRTGEISYCINTLEKELSLGCRIVYVVRGMWYGSVSSVGVLVIVVNRQSTINTVW